MNESKEFIKPKGKIVGYIVYIEEKSIGIDYDSIETKKARPYLYFKRSYILQKNYFMPITDKYSKEGKIKKNKYWVEIKLNKESFVKVDKVLIINKQKLNRYVKSNFIESYKKIDKNKIKQIKKQLKILNKERY